MDERSGGASGPPSGHRGRAAMTDEEYGALMLNPLAGDPAGPPGIDVARAMLDGHRRRFGRWAGGGAVLASLLAILIGGGLALSSGSGRHEPAPPPDLPPDPVVPAACTMSRMPLGDHHSAQVTAGDSTGRWQVGEVEPVAGGSHELLVWHDGKLVDEEAPPSTPESFTMTGINRSGLAVGGSQDGSSYPYLYRDGELTRLKGGHGMAGAINDEGVIAGTIKQGGLDVPVRWRTPDAEPQRLPLPAGIRSTGRILDIEADGTTVGLIDLQPILWLPDGSVRQIPPPTPTARVRATQFHYGWLYFNNFPPNIIWRYEPVSRTWQQTGDVTTLMPDIGVGNDHATVLVGPARTPLPIDPALTRAGLRNIQVTSISDDAHVVTGSAQGGDSDPSKPFQPIIWSCK